MSQPENEERPLITDPEDNQEGANILQRSGVYFNYLENRPFHEEDEEEDEEEIERRNFLVSGHHIDDHLETTSHETLMHLIKGNIGTGILAMADALRNSGLVTGLILLPFIAAICIYCMHSLVKCSVELKRRTGLMSLDYADVTEQAFKTGPPKLQFLAGTAKRITNTFLVITQTGFCCVYFVFISANIKQVVDCNYPEHQYSIHIFMLCLLLPMIAINSVRSLKYLTPFSSFSNAILIVGLSITFYYVLCDLPLSYERNSFASWKTLPLFFGTAIYAFEGIGVVLPLERRMKRPSDFRGFFGVLNTAMILVSCLYIGVGFYGYLKYGDGVKGSITLNLPPHDKLAQLVKILMAAAIFFTYPLMLYVPIQVLWPLLKHKFQTRRSRNIGELVFRAAIVTLTFCFAAIIPDIGIFISLVGAVSSSMLAVIFPPLLQIITFWYRLDKFLVIKSLAIFSFGIVCFVTGSYASIHAIIEYFSGNGLPDHAPVC